MNKSKRNILVLIAASLLLLCGCTAKDMEEGVATTVETSTIESDAPTAITEKVPAVTDTPETVYQEETDTIPSTTNETIAQASQSEPAESTAPSATTAPPQTDPPATTVAPTLGEPMYENETPIG